ncbi:InlB B-repeat-containing protein [Meiothermus taiwanensis]|uniref:Bacterial repeat domain-containing protein n=1 Tax=Meiothermus taiwanensis TaxID=172827 RepID=A0A399E5J0_9DEIN|nr:hypothetical protein [Meiothermus taiwanensis]RIH79146.1 hypothetical protein Mcate_00497 [Meiothermus taiwanensis]
MNKPMRLLNVLILVLLLGFWAQNAHAQNRWLSGNLGFIPGIACVVFIPETAVTAYAAYWGGTSPLFPQTGDVTYVQAVAAVVGNPCSGGDALGFEFFLPPGAEVAASAQNPVRCIARRLRDGYSENVPLPGNTGACSQTPTSGPNGGLRFGFGVVPSGWSFEINVPVRFNRALNGLGEPSSNWLRALVSSSNGNVLVQQPVVVGYRAVVNYPAPSATFQGGTNYRLTTYIYNFFQSGTASIDVGSAPGNYDVGNFAPASVPNTVNGVTVTTDLTLNPAFSGTLYWRARFQTASGTFFGPEQQFTANGANAQTFTLTLNKGGAGSGSVSSDPQGLSCGTTCTQSFTSGTVVTLTATPDPGSSFTGWSGCFGPVGSPTCSVTMDQARTVTANFAVAPPLTVGSFSIQTNGLPNGATASIPLTGPNNYNRTFTIVAGTGQSVSSADAGQYFTTPPNVFFGGSTYVASPATQSFVVPGGGNPTFIVEYRLGRILTINKSGAGSGSVSSTPAGISCGSTCEFAFADGASVTLTPTPAAGSVFAGWGGACSGTGSCTVTMSSAQTVTATFNTAPTQALTVSKSGSGTGTVSSNPAGINCGANCTANFAQNSTVALSAVADSGSNFTGWSGACSGTGTCSVTMDAAKSVTATFTNPNVAPATLAVSKPANAPTDATRNKGQSNVSMLAFTLNPSQATQLQSITLQASGSGNDNLDLTAVRLIRDANANGQIDSGETPIASGTFSADNGTLTLSLSTPLALSPGSSQFLVVADIASTLAARPAMLRAQSFPALPAPLLLPLLLLGAWRMRSLRVGFLALALALTLAACGGGSPNTNPVNKTYQINLTALSAQGNPTVSGLPISGATITVQK